MQIDVLHRHNLGISAACRAALYAEHRTEGRLAQGDDGLFADLGHSLSQTYRCGGLAFTGGSRVDGSHQNELAIGLALISGIKLFAELCLILAVEFQIVGGEPEVSGDLLNGAHFGLLCNFDVRKHIISLLWKKNNCLSNPLYHILMQNSNIFHYFYLKYLFK